MNTRESLFSFLDHSSSIYYIITDAQGGYTYANSLFRKIFGYLSHDISMKEFSAAIHPDDVSIYREAIRNAGPLLHSLAEIENSLYHKSTLAMDLDGKENGIALRNFEAPGLPPFAP